MANRGKQGDDPTTTPAAPLVFVHIPKAAGTALKELIAQIYRGRPMLLFAPGDGRLERFRTLPASSRASVAVLGGHEPFGLQDAFEGTGAEPAVITVLREPVARVVSLYRYIFAESAHFAHARFVAERPTIGEVLGAQDLPPFDNHQVRYLAGRETLGKPFGSLGMADLERAKRNLEHGCRAFGLQHRMTETLGLFRDALHWPPESMPVRNAARTQIETPPVTDADRAAIAEVNRLDADLLAFAEALFDQRYNARSES